MRLSDFFPTEQILRDGDFTALGLSNSKGPEEMLSFLEDARFASELLDNPRIRAVICRPEDGAAVVYCVAPRDRHPRTIERAKAAAA